MSVSTVNAMFGRNFPITPNPFKYELELNTDSPSEPTPTEEEIKKHNEERLNHFCISYNYKTKSFISLHDLTLKNSFNTNIGCYSYYGNFINIFNCVEDYLLPIYEAKYTQGYYFSLYGSATKIVAIHNISLSTTRFPANCYQLAVVMKTFSNPIESLDYVNYKIRKLEKSTIVKFPSFHDYRIDKINRRNQVSVFGVETDLCASKLLIEEIDDTIRPNSLEKYKGMKYHLGSWTINYFRNTLPPDVNYFEQSPTGKMNVYDYPRDSVLANRTYTSDDNSLIYGGYFVLKFQLGRLEKRNKPLELLRSPLRGATDDQAGEEEPTTSEEEPITSEEQESNLPYEYVLYTNPVKIEDININTKRY